MSGSTIYSIHVSVPVEANRAIEGKTKKSTAKTRKIKIYDSKLMIAFSMSELIEQYGDTITKLEQLPYTFINDKTLDYVGPVPAIEEFPNLTIEEHGKMVLLYGKNYSVKRSMLNHVEKASIGMLEVMTAFSNYTFEKYGKLPNKHSTISSLGIHLYLSKYYSSRKHDIRILTGDLARQLRQGYFGGLIYVQPGKYGKGYFNDMRSAYPNAMLNAMPVGEPRIYTIADNYDNMFGFAIAQVTVPADIQVNILPGNITTDENGVKHIEGIYFMDELRNARLYGYTYKVAGFFEFERGEGVFNDFINDLYKARQEARKEGNKIGDLCNKLIMNSTFGKFGAIQNLTKYKISAASDVAALDKIYNVGEATLITEEVSLVAHNGPLAHSVQIGLGATFSSLKEPTEDHTMASVAMAAAISAYNRINQSQYLNMQDNPVIYHDTDCVVTLKPLPDSCYGEELGMMKMEAVFSEAYFIDTKLYAYKHQDNNHLVIKGRGLSNMEYADYEEMLEGKNVIKLMKY